MTVTELLVTTVGEALGSAEQPLDAAAAAVRESFAIDRVSIARIDRGAGCFEIASSIGARLLAAGTALPVSTCSYFVEAAEGRAFHESDFGASQRFSRPLDGVVLAAGFNAGCSVPIRREQRTIGAISLSSASRRTGMAEAARRLEEICPALGVALERSAATAPGLSVLVCGDDPLGVRGIARLAEHGAGAKARTATTLAAAIVEVRTRAPDLIVCAERLGGRPVDEVAVDLRQAGAEAPLVVLAVHDGAEVLRAALRAGAAAYVVRRDAVAALPAALCAVREGRSALPPAPPAGDRLTVRERELLAALDEGLRFKQAARRLGIAETTTKTHGRALFRKLGASSRAEAVRAARDRGLIG